MPGGDNERRALELEAVPQVLERDFWELALGRAAQ